MRFLLWLLPAEIIWRQNEFALILAGDVYGSIPEFLFLIRARFKGASGVRW